KVHKNFLANKAIKNIFTDRTHAATSRIHIITGLNAAASPSTHGVRQNAAPHTLKRNVIHIEVSFDVQNKGPVFPLVFKNHVVSGDSAIHQNPGKQSSVS